eukprot:1161974-Pelagomonas_calceolata.AAC.6
MQRHLDAQRAQKKCSEHAAQRHNGTEGKNAEALRCTNSTQRSSAVSMQTRGTMALRERMQRHLDAQ